jgi:hypothetical protein
VSVPQLPDFIDHSAPVEWIVPPSGLPSIVQDEEELGPTLQSIASGSLKALGEIISKPDLDSDDPQYQFEKNHKLKAIEVGLRTIGKHEENILRKKQIDVIPIILERIAKEEARLLLEKQAAA